MPQIIWDGILGNTIGNQEAELPVRRTQTRQALVLAARDLVLKRGHEKISIQDITIEAGLGTGTFYNYFSTKQDVFEAVLADYRQQFADEIGATRARLKDPATVVAVTLKYYFHQAQHNDQWKNFLIFSGLPDRHVLRQDDDECLADIQRGVKAGRFKVEDSDFARSLISGMVDHINLEIANKRLAPYATDNAVRYILRMLGLPDLVAKALTQSPLPPIAARRDESPRIPIPPTLRSTNL